MATPFPRLMKAFWGIPFAYIVLATLLVRIRLASSGTVMFMVVLSGSRNDSASTQSRTLLVQRLLGNGLGRKMHDRLESERTPLARKARIIASAVN